MSDFATEFRITEMEGQMARMNTGYQELLNILRAVKICLQDEDVDEALEHIKLALGEDDE